MALMAWRTGIGGLSAWNNQSGSMMLGFPEWIVYACMVPPLLLTFRAVEMALSVDELSTRRVLKPPGVPLKWAAGTKRTSVAAGR